MIFNQPKPTNLTKLKIQEIAEKYFYSSGFGEDIIKFVNSIGGYVHFLPIDYKIEHSLIVKRKDKFDIFIHDCLGLARTKHSIAHELGHYVLHSNFGEQPIIAEPYGKSIIESEANWFAMAFLMPQKEFKEELLRRNQNIDLICSLHNFKEQIVKARVDEII
jgi:hypothetical protein